METFKIINGVGSNNSKVKVNHNGLIISQDGRLVHYPFQGKLFNKNFSTGELFKAEVGDKSGNKSKFAFSSTYSETIRNISNSVKKLSSKPLPNGADVSVEATLDFNSFVESLENMSKTELMAHIERLDSQNFLYGRLKVSNDVIKTSKFLKLTKPISKILAFDYLSTILLLNLKRSEMSQDRKSSITALITVLGKIIKGSNLSKEPLSMAYIKSSASEELDTLSCIKVIDAFGKFGLTDEETVILFKHLSFELKLVLSGDPTDTSSKNIKDNDLCKKVVKNYIKLADDVVIKTNRKGDKTKAYKDALRRVEVRSELLLEVIKLFRNSIMDLFDLTDASLKDLLIVLFSLFNFSRLMRGKVSSSDTSYIADLLVSVVGEDNGRLSESDLSELFGSKIEEKISDLIKD